MAPELLYADSDLVVVAKPAGLATHPMPEEPKAPSCLMLMRDALGGRWLYPVHRLDRATSGVLALARSQEAAARLAGAFARGEVDKGYVALVRGHVTAASLIDYPLRPLTGAGEAKPAVTAVAPLACCERPWAVGRYASARYALVGLAPRTGRTHQLRRHLRHIAHPIAGDTVYGDGAHNRALRTHAGLGRLMLHARELSLAHPTTGIRMRWEAAVPDDFCGVLGRLGIDAAAVWGGGSA